MNKWLYAVPFALLYMLLNLWWPTHALATKTDAQIANEPRFYKIGGGGPPGAPNMAGYYVYTCEAADLKRNANPALMPKPTKTNFIEFLPMEADTNRGDTYDNCDDGKGFGARFHANADPTMSQDQCLNGKAICEGLGETHRWTGFTSLTIGDAGGQGIRPQWMHVKDAIGLRTPNGGNRLFQHPDGSGGISMIAAGWGSLNFSPLNSTGVRSCIDNGEYVDSGPFLGFPGWKRVHTPFKEGGGGFGGAGWVGNFLANDGDADVSGFAANMTNDRCFIASGNGTWRSYDLGPHADSEAIQIGVNCYGASGPGTFCRGDRDFGGFFAGWGAFAHVQGIRTFIRDTDVPYVDPTKIKFYGNEPNDGSNAFEQGKLSHSTEKEKIYFSLSDMKWPSSAQADQSDASGIRSVEVRFYKKGTNRSTGTNWNSPNTDRDWLSECDFRYWSPCPFNENTSSRKSSTNGVWNNEPKFWNLTSNQLDDDIAGRPLRPFSFDLDSLEDGDWWIEVSAQDLVGHEGWARIPLTIDSKGPTQDDCDDLNSGGNDNEATDDDIIQQGEQVRCDDDPDPDDPDPDDPDEQQEEYKGDACDDAECDIFDYTVVNSDCTLTEHTVDPSGSSITSASGIKYRNRIVAVTVNLNAMVGLSDQQAKQKLRTTIEMPTRRTSTYRQALGCSE